MAMCRAWVCRSATLNWSGCFVVEASLVFNAGLHLALRHFFGGDQMRRVPVEFFRAIVIDVRFYDDAFVIDPEVCGYAGNFVVLVSHFLAGQEYRLFQVCSLRKPHEIALRFVPRIDSQYNQTVISVSFGQAAQVRSLRTTGRSPMSEETQ